MESLKALSSPTTEQVSLYSVNRSQSSGKSPTQGDSDHLQKVLEVVKRVVSAPSGENLVREDSIRSWQDLGNMTVTPSDGAFSIIGDQTPPPCDSVMSRESSSSQAGSHAESVQDPVALASVVPQSVQRPAARLQIPDEEIRRLADCFNQRKFIP